ncbi:hypothetical protein N180_03675 [Pedobacter antarcticus 4BY]|uniref:Uncharacterized protein n=1 Tax=Pedobacter antarcticus 4BY TaxID=1358423 RepID=A0A081PFJ5_9SPHI|nr:hypothetical protein N180_03675 [Pedobacter antarcticus 4BY]
MVVPWVIQVLGLSISWKAGKMFLLAKIIRDFSIKNDFFDLYHGIMDEKKLHLVYHKTFI